MRLSMFRSPLAVGLAAALAFAGAASAETKVRVQNDTPNPATFTLDGRSKDIRPRKAMTFPINGTTGAFSVYFANGMADRGELDVGYAGAVVGTEDGIEYRCISLEETGIKMWEQEDCAKKVNKPKG